MISDKDPANRDRRGGTSFTLCGAAVVLLLATILPLCFQDIRILGVLGGQKLLFMWFGIVLLPPCIVLGLFRKPGSRKLRWSLVAITLATAVNGGHVLPWYVGKPSDHEVSGAKSKSMRLLLLNLPH